MDAETFRHLRDLVYDYCGILVRDDMQYVMERRLWPRLEAHGLRDFGAYHHLLRFDPGRKAELDLAVEALTTHETYFFREPHQLRAFSEELLPVLAERNAPWRRLRIWSAGCSSGEEAYTIAALIHDSGRFEGWDVEVFGTDISRRVLATARQAEYGPSALRATAPEDTARYFEAVGNRFRVKPHLRALVSFGHLNLLDAEMAQLVPRMDVIFCRNVMIYFDTPARNRVLQLFHGKLVEGGYLLLGHSESLISLSADFELVHLRNDLVYRRPLGQKVGE
ncbi:MAG: protein-glutamate O-methyltransferase CheR [Myxococcaceae bacterium]|nr:protein-glutamate O-methyltransferase CheR [Myxococcaceae bacterium]